MTPLRAGIPLGAVVRIAGSLLLLAAIFWFLPVGDVVAAMARIGPHHWAIALSVFMLGHVVSAAKWQLLADSGAGFAAALRAHFSGLVANLWLPGVAGGDVVRGALLYRRAPDTARLAVGSLADRLVDTFGLLTIAAAGLVFAFPQRVTGAELLRWLAAAVGVLAVGAVAALYLQRFLARRIPPHTRLGRLLDALTAGTRVLLRQPLRLVTCLALSIAVQVAFITANAILAAAAGLHLPMAAWFFAWPLSKIIATAPISLGGLGVREASLAGLLAPFGAASAAVVATGLIWQSVLIAGSCLGAALVLLVTRALPTKRAQLT